MVLKGNLLRTGMIVLVMAVGSWPAMAGSAVIGSVAGSRNATLGGQALLPNTTVFSGDSLQVQDGVAVVALDGGSRMVFGRQTLASFLREAEGVTVLLGQGNVSMYRPATSAGLRVKVGAVTVEPVGQFKTLGEVAMVDGAVVVTSKEGTLKVEEPGHAMTVGQGKSVTLNANPAPAPQMSSAHITTASALSVGSVAAGGTAAVLSGLAIGRAGEAKDAANAASTTAAAAASAANAATAAANAATAAANTAASNANSVGCALNTLANSQGQASPYTPPTGFKCP